MTIKTKLLLLSVAGVLPAIVIALTGHETIVQMDSATRGIVTSGAALRNLWEGDMMHEGLRADVYATLAAGTDPEKQRVRSGLAEHAKRFRDAVARNRSLALDSRIGSALSELGPSLEAYIREAEAITTVAANDRNAAVQRLPAFEKAFEALDAAQAKVSELIKTALRALKSRAAGRHVPAAS